MLFNRDDVTNHPQLDLFKLCFPALLECLHPAPVVGGVRNVDDNSNKVVSIDHARLTPLTFDALRLIAGGPELFDDLQNRISQPFARNVAAVVELEWEQHLVSPPLAAHSSPFP
jgi:hypothetical protein